MRPRLDHIDALRGLAAMYVVLHHTIPAIAAPGSVMAAWQALFLYGRAGVDLFLVVSGFVLFLPIVQGWREIEPYGRFMARRAWRIVPPYYAALAFSLAVLWCVPALTIKLRYAADLSPANLTAHALLVNNLGPPNWQYGINYPLWTIPLEFQLYATFPVLALALARLGPAWALATAVALTTGARYLVAHGLLPAPLSMSVPGYLGVFVAGMAAAALYERPGLPRRALGAGALALVASGVASWHTRASFVAADVLFGLGFAALVLWLGGRAPVVPRPLVGLGRMSYSLYLIHAMLLGLWRMGVAPLHLTPPVYLALTVFVGVPGIVAVAYAFHLAVERPFLGRPPMLAPKPVQEAA